MPPRRGRPPLVRPQAPIRAEELANPFTALYPPDRTKVECQLCHEAVPSIIEHLREKHPTVLVEEYTETFKSAPLEGDIDPVSESDRAVSVSAAEIRAHPGGRAAAVIEKALDRRERSAYREDVAALVDQGHIPSHQVASVAYLMTLSRRVRMRIEKTRDQTGGEVFHSEALEMWHAIEARIGKGIQDLEKIRAQRVDEVGEEDPLHVVTRELAEAETWVQSRIGEFMARCPAPNCGQMLTVPALPHWAFEPMQTDQGLVWPVWSREMWKLVLSGEMRLSVAAYCLRTSPEGLKYTAAQRKEPWPADIDIGEAEAELRARLIADDRERTMVALPEAGNGGPA